MKNTKQCYIFFILLFMVFASKSQTPITVIKPIFSCYNTAMGKGRGIIFKFQVPILNYKKISIDSFYVNSTSIPVLVKKTGNTFFVEANYLKNIDEPIVDYKVSKDTEDAMVLKHQFKPAWIVVTVNGRHKKIPIVNFKEIKSN